MPYDMYKAAGIIIKNRKVLVTRTKGKTVFIQPGGKLEPGETSVQALIRELQEEQGITTTEHDLSFFGTYYAIAAGHETEQLQLRLDAFIVSAYTGNLIPQSEVEENRWVTSSDAKSIELGSIFAHDIIPKLVELDLID